MSDKNHTVIQSDHSDDQAREREPYEPPAVVGEQLFETLALACGKTQPTSLQCLQVPQMS
jgi:hypothetical protein